VRNRCRHRKCFTWYKQGFVFSRCEWTLDLCRFGLTQRTRLMVVIYNPQDLSRKTNIFFLLFLVGHATRFLRYFILLQNLWHILVSCAVVDHSSFKPRCEARNSVLWYSGDIWMPRDLLNMRITPFVKTRIAPSVLGLHIAMWLMSWGPLSVTREPSDNIQGTNLTSTYAC